MPFVNNVRKFDGRVVTLDSQPERFFTQEQKALIIDSYAKYRIADTATFYKATNGEESRAAGLLSQRINDGLRNQVAIRTIQEVVSGERDELMENITRQLDEVAQTELGVEMVDVRVKQIDLPPEVSESVFRRMNAEREKEARERRSQGKELAEGIRAAADREVTVLSPTPTVRPSRSAVKAMRRRPACTPMLSARIPSSTPSPAACAPIRTAFQGTATCCWCSRTASSSAT
jgi:membrane protease subunit HflC